MDWHLIEQLILAKFPINKLLYAEHSTELGALAIIIASIYTRQNGPSSTNGLSNDQLFWLQRNASAEWPLIAFLAAGAHSSCVDYVQCLCDVRSQLLVGCLLGNASAVQSLLDQRAMAPLMLKATRPLTAAQAQTLVNTHFAQLVNTCIQIDSVVKTDLIELLEQRITNELRRQIRFNDQTQLSYFLFDTPQSGQEVGTSALLLNLLLVLFAVTGRITSTLNKLLSALLVECSGRTDDAAAAQHVDWLVEAVLKRSDDDGDDLSANDNAVIGILICMLTGRFPTCELDSKQQINDALQLLLDHSELQAAVTYAESAACPVVSPAVLSPFSASSRREYERVFLSQAFGDSLSEIERLRLVYIRDVLDLRPIAQFLDADGLVALKLNLDVDELRYYADSTPVKPARASEAVFLSPPPPSSIEAIKAEPPEKPARASVRSRSLSRHSASSSDDQSSDAEVLQPCPINSVVVQNPQSLASDPTSPTPDHLLPLFRSSLTHFSRAQNTYEVESGDELSLDLTLNLANQEILSSPPTIDTPSFPPFSDQLDRVTAKSELPNTQDYSGLENSGEMESSVDQPTKATPVGQDYIKFDWRAHADQIVLLNTSRQHRRACAANT